MAPIDYKVVEDQETIFALNGIEQRVWGIGPSESDGPYNMLAVAHNGGLILGAFDGDVPIGFSYSFPGYQDGEVYLWSHTTGVLPEYQAQGIGQQLKFQQRDWAREYGYATIRWTFDPMQQTNARFNLHHLGGIVTTFHENRYGTIKAGLNSGLPTDRYEVTWHTNPNRDVKPSIDFDAENVLVQNGAFSGSIGDSDAYLLEIPADISHLKQTNPEVAIIWQSAIREASIKLLGRNYTISRYVEHNGKSYYAALR